MRFPREKREARAVVTPPPEVTQRVDGGGPWGPTQFDLPDRTGNSQAILVVALVGVVVLLVIAALWTLAYFQFT